MRTSLDQDLIPRDSHRVSVWAIAVLALLATSCTTDEEPEPDDPVEGPIEGIVGACLYESPFTGGDECREYSGGGWLESDAISACQQLAGNQDMGGRCPATYTLGTCVLDNDADLVTTVFIYGEDATQCDTQKTGCEVFGGGRWVPSAQCEAGGGPPSGGNVFIQPTLECREPIDGEPAGQSEDGLVCTWQSISASTEEGRHFADYASCDVVYSQRPYYPIGPAPTVGEPDERMSDPVYVAELDWVRSQLEASACVCCHSTESPAGPSNWYFEAPGNWMSTFYDTGLAMGANFIRSESFGGYPPEQNNGFSRGVHSGMPSTDPLRMQAFFIDELAYRGLGPDDFEGFPEFGGPLADQLEYRPGACENGERVNPDGTVVWDGGPARYVYVLQADAHSPTVPPNLDLPTGTMWRLDVPADQEPVQSGEVVYGTVPENLVQRYPETDSPAPLEPGVEYYLYVTRDVIQPVTRCLFTY